jgi:2-oxoglutarate dehydrogenase complex dehydrogenase (E1) component-like enzyme
MKLYNEFDISWCLLVDNLNELQLFINKYISRKKISTDFKKEGYLRHLNYKLINAISSVYIFYNIVIGLVERNFDKETRDEVESVFRKMYDESQAYRFSYQLRGYVNHKNLPLNVLDSDLSTDELILTLNTYKLFNSSYSWNAKVKKEFIDVQEISIKTMIINLFAVYFEHYPMILKVIKEKLQPYNEIIDELELKFNPNQTHTLRVIWDLDKRVEEIRERMNPFNEQEFIRIIQKGKFK